MAPVNQLGVLAFASAVLAVPHAQWQPFKRHAHPGAPPSYGSSEPAAYSSAGAASGSAPAYGSGSSAAAVSASSGWSAPAYPSGSSAAAVSGSGSAPPYPSASGSKSGWAFPSGGYGSASSSAYGTGYGTGYSSSWGAVPTGYSGATPSYSTCTETSTLIYRSTTELSTYYITHTIYESPSASVAPASVSASYGAGSGGDGGAGGWGSGAPSDPTCAPDVTVTQTVKTTVYVTAGAGGASGYPTDPSGGLPVNSAPGYNYGGGSSSASAGWSSAGAASYSAGASSSAAAPSYPAGSPSSPAAPTYSSGTTSSAAAPGYSSSPSGGSGGGAAGTLGKRGIAYNDVSLADALGGTKAGGWAYNWVSSSGGLKSSIPYIPMLHDASSTFTGSWESDAKAGIAAGAQYLFSFNEPDMTTQADLTPAAAAAAWKQYMEPFAGQAKLVAPSVTNSQSANMGLDWLQQFLEACSDCTIDSVAQHWYFPTNDVENFKDQITNAAKTAGGKGVWISEFGATGTDQEKSEFLTQVLPWLDSNPDVLGYSYFMVSDGLLMTGNSPSTYGQTYVDTA